MRAVNCSICMMGHNASDQRCWWCLYTSCLLYCRLWLWMQLLSSGVAVCMCVYDSQASGERQSEMLVCPTSCCCRP